MDTPVGGNTDSTASAPATFDAAFAADAAAASPAAETSTQTTTPASAETSPAADGAQPQQSDERSPFIPRSRFDEVNTQKNELQQKLQALSWAEQLDQSQLQSALQWYSRYTGNPIEFLQSVAAEVQAHPEWGPQLKSFAARALSQRSGASEPTMPEADVAITDAQGNVVGRTYSADQLAKRDEWLTQRVLAQVEQRFQPVTKTVQDIAAERQQALEQQQADRFAATFFGEIGKLPGLAEHKEAVQKELAATKLASDDPAEVKAAFYQAYLKVVLPTLGAKAQSQLLDNLQQQAAASTGVNPGSAASSTARAYRSFHELPPDAWK